MVLASSFHVESAATSVEAGVRTSHFSHQTTSISLQDGVATVRPVSTDIAIKTDVVVPKTGVLFVGWGGNNGTTVTAGILANKQ
jgi:myo-inositol-1-phosphate synthase